MKNKCSCGKNNWEWTLDSQYRSWIKCKDCGDNMFEDGIGVILISWEKTDINQIDLATVLRANMVNKGIVQNITQPPIQKEVSEEKTDVASP